MQSESFYVQSRFLKREGLRVVHAPDVQAAKHAEYNSSRAAACRGPRQSTNEVLMVAPTAFGFNAEAAEDNSFMHSGLSEEQTTVPTNHLRSKVLREFSALHRELSEVRSALSVAFSDENPSPFQ